MTFGVFALSTNLRNCVLLHIEDVLTVCLQHMDMISLYLFICPILI